MRFINPLIRSMVAATLLTIVVSAAQPTHPGLVISPEFTVKLHEATNPIRIPSGG